MRSAFRRYLTKKRIRNVLQVTWRRCYNVPGTSCKLREEDVTTYQEHLASYLKKNLQCIRNILQVTWRRCFNVAGTSCMLLEEDLTTYQERLACYLKKLFECIRNVLQVTWRRCYNVSGASGKLLEEDVATYVLQVTSRRVCWTKNVCYLWSYQDIKLDLLNTVECLAIFI